MATNIYSDGLGGSVDFLVIDKPLYSFGGVARYVHFPTGDDLGGNDGQDKQWPMKTFGACFDECNPGDIIVLLDGHEELNFVAKVIDKANITVVGCGQTAGIPNVKFVLDTLTVTAANFQLRNIRIMPSEDSGGSTSPRIEVSGAGFTMDGCYVECGSFDLDPAVLFKTGASDVTIRDTTFISTSLVFFTRPSVAITADPGIDVGKMVLEGLVLSDGTVGFLNHYAFDFAGSTISALRAELVTLLLGASMRVGANAVGYIVPKVSGGGTIVA